MSHAPGSVTPDESNLRLGIALMLATTFVFSVQDALTRHLAAEYSLMLVVMIRYWFFAAFVIAIAARKAGGLGRVARTDQPLLQIFRGVLLAAEISVMAASFLVLGLVETHAVFAAYPLIIAALSGPVLGEKVGWRRWMAIAVGFLGILIVLQPGSGVMQAASLIPLCAAAMFALYGLLTRYAARRDSPATSFFWTGVAGAAAMTVTGVWFWQPIAAADLPWLALLCLCGVLGHGLLIRCYAVAEASAVQPFAYFQLVFASAIGISVFGEVLRWNIALGAAIIVGAGVFTLLRARRRAR